MEGSIASILHPYILGIMIMINLWCWRNEKIRMKKVRKVTKTIVPEFSSAGG